MGIPVFILGESGSGKTCSLRNFEPEELIVFNVVNKLMPFRKKMNVIQNATYSDIGKIMQKKEKKIYVVDDSQYLLSFEFLDRAKETGYNKFTELALRFRNMLDFVIKGLPDDTIVYFLHHCETTDTGKIKAMTVGKILDNILKLEGLLSIVLYCETDGKEHRFITQSDGYTTAKSPMEMLPLEMDNDLKAVDTAIREYLK